MGPDVKKKKKKKKCPDYTKGKTNKLPGAGRKKKNGPSPKIKDAASHCTMAGVSAISKNWDEGGVKKKGF